MRIEKLTPEQKKYLPVFREEWRQIGLSTEPCNQDKVITSVKNLYSVCGLNEPRVLFFSSPVLCLWARKILIAMGEKQLKKNQLGDQLRGQLEGQLRDQLWGQLGGQLRGQLGGQLRGQLWGQLGGQLRGQLGGQLRGQLWDQLEGQLRGQLRGQLWDQLEGQLWGQLGDQLEGQLWGQLGDQLRGQLWDQLEGQLWGQLGDQLRGQLGGQLRGQLGGQLGDSFQSLWTVGGMDAYWLAFYKFGQEIGVKYDNQTHFDAYIEYARNCGVMFAYEGFAFVSDRPSELHFNQDHALHNENGMAIKFRDGWGVSAWNGVRVPDHWIAEKDTLDPNEIIRTENVEQRVAGCNILGWAKIADRLNKKVLDGDPDSDIGALVELSLDGLPEPGRFLMAKCPRNGTICEGVPRKSDIDGLPIDTAIAAQAWRIGDPQSEYIHPTQRS